MNEGLNITPEQLMQIIGSKEVELCVLRGQISELTRENTKLKEAQAKTTKDIPSVLPEDVRI